MFLPSSVRYGHCDQMFTRPANAVPLEVHLPIRASAGLAYRVVVEVHRVVTAVPRDDVEIAVSLYTIHKSNAPLYPLRYTVFDQELTPLGPCPRMRQHRGGFFYGLVVKTSK